MKKEEDLEGKIKKLKFQVKHYKQLSTALEKERLTENDFINRMGGVLSVLEPPKHYIPNKMGRGDSEELVLLFSDCQIGEKIEYKETRLGTYNINIFKKELHRLYNTINKITDLQRKSIPIHNLNVFMLGDIVEGEQIFKGQGSRLETSVAEQFFKGKYEIGNFLRSLSGNYKKVKITAIAGNHGRINPKDESKFYVNWDYLMYKFLETELKECKNIKFKIPQTWWDITTVKGWKFYLDHGDTIARRYMGIPWYGLEKGDGRVMKMMQAVDKKYDYIAIGHHHTAFQWDAAHGERFCNGSFSTANYYAARRLQLMTRPTQMLFGVHPKVGVTFRYLLRLDLPEKEYK